jgi:hypothetical protein
MDSGQVPEEIKRELDDIRVGVEVGMREVDQPPYITGDDQVVETDTFRSLQNHNPELAEDNATIKSNKSSSDMSELPDKKPDQSNQDSDPLNGNSAEEIEEAMQSPNDNQEAEQPEVDQENPEHSSGEQKASTAEIKQMYSDKIDQIKDAVSAGNISDEFRNTLKSAQKLFEKYYLTKRNLDVAKASDDDETVQDCRETLENGLADGFKDALSQLFYEKARNSEDYDTLLRILPDNMSEYRERAKLEKEKFNHMAEAASEVESMYKSASGKLIEDKEGKRWHMGWRDSQSGAVLLYEHGKKQGKRWVPFVDDDMRTFGERFDIVRTAEEVEYNQARQTAINQVRSLKDEGFKNLVRDEQGQYWNVGWVEDGSDQPQVVLFEAGKENKVTVPFTDNDGRTFTDRYAAVTDPDEVKPASKGSTSDKQDIDRGPINESEKSSAEKQNTERNVEYSEKRPDESLLSYVYNQVDDEQRELLKQIRNELSGSEYEGKKRLNEKFADNPTEVLKSILGLKNGDARHGNSFPKNEILKTLGSIENISDTVITSENIKKMVRAGYDSEWDIWWRVKNGNTYESQDGTLYAKLSGKEYGVWAKFNSREDYKKYREGQEVRPIGRRLGLGDMHELFEDDINKIKNQTNTQEQTGLPEIKEGDTVMLTEGGNGYEVAGIGEIAGSRYAKLKDGRAMQIQEVIKKEQEKFDPENALTRAEVQEIIKNTDVSEPEAVADEILKNDSFFWKEVEGNKRYAVKDQDRWMIYDAELEKIVDRKESKQMEKETVQGVRDSEVWSKRIEVNEKVRSTIGNFEQNSTKIIDQIIAAVPDPESAKPSTERQEREQSRNYLASLKHSIHTFSDQVFNQAKVSIDGIRETRNSYVRLCNYTEKKQTEIWREAGLVYHRDVREVVAEIDSLLENRS